MATRPAVCCFCAGFRAVSLSDLRSLALAGPPVVAAEIFIVGSGCGYSVAVGCVVKERNVYYIGAGLRRREPNFWGRPVQPAP